MQSFHPVVPVTAFAVLAVVASCSSSGPPTLSSDAGQSGEPDEPTTTAAVSDTGAEASGGDTDGGAETGPDEATDGAETSSGGDGGEDTDVTGMFSTCPARMPNGWVFCEDFETVEDPAAVFFEFQDDDGAFVLDEGEAASGKRSMRATYEEGLESTGWFSVSFGENPVAAGATRPQYDEAQAFEEVYWRLRIKMQPGWPDAGPHKLTRLTAFADENWGEAIVANLWSNGDDVVLAGDASTCVYGNEVPCQGSGDTSGLESLGLMVGQSPLFSEEYAGVWHCVEGHVRLNTPGVADGAFEFWVDDLLEASLTDLDWRGTWTDYGLNQLTIENFWNGGAPETLSRWIDDIVISTEPIGCK